MKEEMEKRFDEKFGKKINYVNYCLSLDNKMLDVNNIKSFIQSEIDLAVAEERKRIIGEITKEVDMTDQQLQDFLSIIQKDK